MSKLAAELDAAATEAEAEAEAALAQLTPTASPNKMTSQKEALPPSPILSPSSSTPTPINSRTPLQETMLRVTAIRDQRLAANAAQLAGSEKQEALLETVELIDDLTRPIGIRRL